MRRSYAFLSKTNPTPTTNPTPRLLLETFIVQYCIVFCRLMSAIFDALIFGIVIGSIYSLIALGYTMVYGILKFINFAHGEIFMVGGFIVYFLSVEHGVNFFLACAVSIVLTGMLGVAVERIAYRPLRGSGRLSPLITAIGVSLFLQSLMQLFFGANFKTFTTAINRDVGFFSYSVNLFKFLGAPISVMGANITRLDVIIILLSLVLMVLLHLFVTKTRIGIAMRAVADDFQTASITGINVDRVVSSTFALGSSLAAVGGIMYTLKFALSPTAGVIPGIKAFTAAVVGGIGNMYGAMFGGLLIGLSENLGIVFIPSGYKDAISFLILILFLLFRPSGMFGATGGEVSQK
jgi:branched-chain amino acid transport system permease protein